MRAKIQSMKILFITRLFDPHLGGVEKHVYEVSKVLTTKGHKVRVISEADIKYPHTKFVGLVSIWVWLFKNRKLIETADVVHCHDVFIWYLPFVLLYPRKKILVTFHGWREIVPIPKKDTLLNWLAVKLAKKTIAIGSYVNRIYKIDCDLVVYGSSDIHNYREPKDKKRIVYIGRLEENTGILIFLKWLKKNPGYKVDFCGDGDKRSECEKYGTVHGFTDPNPFYKVSKTVVPGGYLSALEALNSGCDIKLFWNNKLKEDYWKMSPFWKLKGDKLRKWAREQTWKKLTNEYLNLYNSIK